MRATATALTLSFLLLATPREARRAGPDCRGFDRFPGEKATINENRTPAGVRRGDTLDVTLVVRKARWYPEGEASCGISVFAFAEEGKAPSVPAPLLRVPGGTVVRARVRSAVDRTLYLHGFGDRPASERNGVELAPGAERAFTFTATATGTFGYRASLTPDPDAGRGPRIRSLTDDSQLMGALIVDPRGGRVPADERVMVITQWATFDSSRAGGERPVALFGLITVNGRSWPHTERLTYTVGDSVHWRVLNGSVAPHPMHLHGFYFRVEEKGDWYGAKLLQEPRTVVTEQVAQGQSMRISWKAERAGNWLFHCHLLPHMAATQRLDMMPRLAALRLAASLVPDSERQSARDLVAPSAPSEAGHGGQGGHGADHAMKSMAGLVVGVQVRPRSGAMQATRHDVKRRTMRLYADERLGPDGRPARYGFVLQSGAQAPARDSVSIPSSTIVLQRGEPAQITVFNRLRTPLSVHWHGLELESYYDGVGGWSGSPGSIAPMIAPGDSFVVRLTPPRSGTFMYHVHGEDGHELALGLYGAFLVVDDRAKRDTTHELTWVFADAGPNGREGAALNGTQAPRLTMVAGRPYRLRLAGIVGDLAAQIAILRGSDTLSWRILARDGAELTSERAEPEPATRRIGAGQTLDVEFMPPGPGELTLTVQNGLFGDGRLIKPILGKRWTAPISVVAPQVSARPRSR